MIEGTVDSTAHPGPAPGVRATFAVLLTVVLWSTPADEWPLIVDAAGEWWLDDTPDAPGSRALMALLGFGAAWALRRRHRSAIELVVWLILVTLLTFGPVRLHPPPAAGLHLPAIGQLVALTWVLIFFVRHRSSLFRPAPEHGSAARDTLVGLRITVALFMMLEMGADLAVRFRNPTLLSIAASRDIWAIEADNEIPRDRPLVVTLGSSGANMEREASESFSVLLERRLGRELSFLYTDQGGLDSEKLLRETRRLLSTPPAREGGTRPDALLWYSGFQDINSSQGLGMLRSLDPVASTGWSRRTFTWIVRRSSLVTLCLWYLYGKRCQHGGEVCRDLEDDEVFAVYSRNLGQVVELTRAGRIALFLITLDMDRRRVDERVTGHVDRVNGHLAALANEHAHVELIDFHGAIVRQYPKGAGTDCEPYEPGWRPGECGNQYHLSRTGHRILAGEIEGHLRRWVAR